uniref:C-type lectin domain-containing protein n=1 Tax=Knipowitschia caucasica TaxID=637954 RepID=A0AAV2L7G2_KNICA
MYWDKAQDHCRSVYTDLAPVSNKHDMDLFLDDDRINNRSFFWIGLMRNPNNKDQWLWSGGGEVRENQSFWLPNEPNNHRGTEDYGCQGANVGWNDAPYDRLFSFFCYKVHVVRERKTWEEALDHCREHHKDLASVASDTELMLMEKELVKALISEQVWIGLAFLSGHWLWVDGQPLEYEAWGRGVAPECPGPNGCAALLVEGDVKVWSARGCSTKLYFLCY